MGNLICDPISYFLSLAIADRVFGNERITSLEDLMRIQVPPQKNMLSIPWAAKWRTRPVFRDIDENGQMSDTKPYSYSKLYTQIRRISKVLGFEEILQFYDLRRAGGKKLTGKY